MLRRCWHCSLCCDDVVLSDVRKFEAVRRVFCDLGNFADLLVQPRKCKIIPLGASIDSFFVRFKAAVPQWSSMPLCLSAEYPGVHLGLDGIIFHVHCRLPSAQWLFGRNATVVDLGCHPGGVGFRKWHRWGIYDWLAPA